MRPQTVALHAGLGLFMLFNEHLVEVIRLCSPFHVLSTSSSCTSFSCLSRYISLMDRKTSLQSRLLLASTGTGRHCRSQVGTSSSRRRKKTVSSFSGIHLGDPFPGKSFAIWFTESSCSVKMTTTVTVSHQREVSLRSPQRARARCQCFSARQIMVSCVLLRRVRLGSSGKTHPREFELHRL